TAIPSAALAETSSMRFQGRVVCGPSAQEVVCRAASSRSEGAALTTRNVAYARDCSRLRREKSQCSGKLPASSFNVRPSYTGDAGEAAGLRSVCAMINRSAAEARLRPAALRGGIAGDAALRTHARARSALRESRIRPPFLVQ